LDKYFSRLEMFAMLVACLNHDIDVSWDLLNYSIGELIMLFNKKLIRFLRVFIIPL
jgi:hypothetical protein